MQESDKHGPRVDEDLKHQDASLTHGAGVEARSQEARLEQDLDGLPNPADRPDIPVPDGLGLDPRNADHRAELAIALPPSAFPGTGAALFEAASEQSRGSAEVLASLRSLPDGRIFQTVEEVWEALGGQHEGHHS